MYVNHLALLRSSVWLLRSAVWTEPVANSSGGDPVVPPLGTAQSPGCNRIVYVVSFFVVNDL